MRSCRGAQKACSASGPRLLCAWQRLGERGVTLIGLTDDESGELVSAGAVLVPDLADEGGVDGVVHFPHRQLVVVDLHGVGQRTRGPAEEADRKYRHERRRGGNSNRSNQPSYDKI